MIRPIWLVHFPGLAFDELKTKRDPEQVLGQRLTNSKLAMRRDDREVTVER
jgi:hypothetical protein